MHVPPTTYRSPRPRGFSLLELEVSLVLLGIALTGMLPLVAIHFRAMEKLQKRVSPQATCYLAPSSDQWARKLGASARLVTSDPGSPAPPCTDPQPNEVRILSFQRTLGNEEVSARVTVNPVVPP